MKTSKFIAAAAAVTAMALAFSAQAQSSSAPMTSDAWTYRVTVYAWLASFKGSTTISGLPGDGSFGAETSGGALDHLKFAAMGTIDARKGPWSFITDLIYLDLGGHKATVKEITGPGGQVTIPININTNIDMKGTSVMTGVGYTLAQAPTYVVDGIVGLRYMRINGGIDWELAGPAGVVPARGSASRSTDLYDGVVGIRGNTDFDPNWFLRYYGDVGGGSSKYTWQAFAAVGYRFAWGDALVGYRHLAYKFDNNGLANDAAFSGPMIGVAFKF